MTAQHMTHAVALSRLVSVADTRAAAITVFGLSLDSRSVAVGDVFIALAGSQFDGRRFIDAAIAEGAVAVLLEAVGDDTTVQWRGQVPLIAIEQLQQQVSAIAGAFYGHPSSAMDVVAVTGTNGKTSCARLVQQLHHALGASCGVMGTLGNSLTSAVVPAINTTADPISVQQQLAEWQLQQVNHVAMEVSSHALSQSRVAGLAISTAIFTNLSRDHLDYHGDMQSYGSAKRRLFTDFVLRNAIINIDDAFGALLLADLCKTSAQTQALSYSLNNTDADLYLSDVRFHLSGVTAMLHSPWGVETLQSPLLGEFNLANVLAAIAAVVITGTSLSDVIAACASLQPVAGRMQRIDTDADVEVVVDYAHTPDALEKALLAMRRHASGQLWCVFGCGGDRDVGKRPLMGRIASVLADHVIVTSDNPRSELPESIIADIITGCASAPDVEVDRAVAIEQAIASAQAGDSVLIAGKGHEQYQQVGAQRFAFDDALHARNALLRRVAP